MPLCVHCSIIYSSQDVEAARVPISRWADKKLWYIYTMEYYLAVKKKEQNESNPLQQHGWTWTALY